jgi:hypothetical protein
MLNENDKRIEEILNSLEGAQRATPGPYFFTRLQQRLKSTPASTWEKIGRWISQPVVAFGSLLLIILLNIALVFNPADKQERFEEGDEYTTMSATTFDYPNSEIE